VPRCQTQPEQTVTYSEGRIAIYPTIVMAGLI